MNTFDIAVIGGGASGLISAITAGQVGKKVAVLEKLNRVGKKIIATGNGRCNLTNVYAEPSKYHGENRKFVMSAFSKFGVDKTVKFFENTGILTCELEEGKIFPSGLQASTVLDFLRLALNKYGVSEITEFEVVKIKKQGEKFEILSKNGDKVVAERVIVSVGGKAGPQFGTDGSSYKLLEDLGHKKTKILPALTRLKTSDPWHKALQGVKFEGEAMLFSENKPIRSERGEILFTDYGLSGPPILQLSGEAVKLLDNKKKTQIRLDIMPEKTQQEIENIIKLLIKNNPEMTLEFFFSGFLNKQMGKILAKAVNLGKLSRKAGELTLAEIEEFVKIIKNWSFEVVGDMGFKDAQTTSGGILTSEINPSTMESKIVKGLYITGEVIDIYGDCGGYNLQWAWSSGFLAGTNAAM